MPLQHFPHSSDFSTQGQKTKIQPKNTKDRRKRLPMSTICHTRKSSHAHPEQPTTRQKSTTKHTPTEKHLPSAPSHMNDIEIARKKINCHHFQGRQRMLSLVKQVRRVEPVPLAAGQDARELGSDLPSSSHERHGTVNNERVK